MSRAFLRRPSILALSAMGWALLFLWWLPMAVSLVDLRIIVGDWTVIGADACAPDCDNDP